MLRWRIKRVFTMGPTSIAKLSAMKYICNADPSHLPWKQSWITSMPPGNRDNAYIAYVYLPSQLYMSHP